MMRTPAAMRIPGLRRDERGSMAVEFALVLPLFLVLLVAIIELATFFWTRNTLQFAVEEASRLAYVNSAAAPSAVVAAVRGKLKAAALDDGRVSVTAALDPHGGVHFMKVTASYAWPAAGITGLSPVDFGPAVGQARVPMLQ